MAGGVFTNLIPCEFCGHGIGFHEGGGCQIRACGCNHTRETVLEQTIALSVHEHHEQFQQGK